MLHICKIFTCVSETLCQLPQEGGRKKSLSENKIFAFQETFLIPPDNIQDIVDLAKRKNINWAKRFFLVNTCCPGILLIVNGDITKMEQFSFF